MREVLSELLAWWRAGESVGVGTVVATFQSAPRPPGASMLVGPDGSAVGSVLGGCVEGAVYDLAQEVVDDPEQTGWDEQADFVVVGCGGAGVCAAIEAAEAGLSVIIRRGGQPCFVRRRLSKRLAALVLRRVWTISSST